MTMQFDSQSNQVREAKGAFSHLGACQFGETCHDTVHDTELWPKPCRAF